MATKKAAQRRTEAKPKDDDGEDHDTRRALWSGTISFGLLQIPVSLHTAEQPSELHFHQLDRHDLAPIHYERVNATTGKIVEWKDIARGYEHAKGEFVVITDKDLAAANVEATQTIDLLDFVDAKAILPSFFERPYFVSPGKRAEKAYALFRDALVRKKVAAIGNIVIRTRQHLCALLVQEGVLTLEVLRFAHELRGTEGLSLPKGETKATARELDMAEALIETMRADWDPSKYKDSYQDDLLALIEKKAKTGKVPAPTKREARRSAPADLMALLRRSVAARAQKPAAGRSRRRAGAAAAA
jgi:DNA end-binding protein Ku